jgi:hypothetical protein
MHKVYIGCDCLVVYSILICFVRIDFSEQYCIEDEVWDACGDEKSISSEPYQR